MYIYDIKITHSLNILVDLSLCQIRASLHANMFGGILDKQPNGIPNHAGLQKLLDEQAWGTEGEPGCHCSLNLCGLVETSNSGTPKSSILIEFSIQTIHFGVPLF